MAKNLQNPFRPGAGHMPPYLAGRSHEKQEFTRLLDQEAIVENLVLTGLRGVGKTVLLETFKPLAVDKGWFWVGTDLSESVSVSEDKLALRLLTDLAVATSSIVVSRKELPAYGFAKGIQQIDQSLDFEMLLDLYQKTPGLVADKLKRVLEVVWEVLKSTERRGLIFAYDEAQLLSDNADKNEYPLSLLLDVFQSIQRKGVQFMLVLTGLPTLFPKLVEARTYAERMFRVVFLDRLDEHSSADAIRKPTEKGKSRIQFTEKSIDTVIQSSGGYPYFIQFICREIFDIWVQSFNTSQEIPSIPIHDIIRKLDTDFFAGRWARATDRQRDLLIVIAHLEHCNHEFSVQEVVDMSKSMSEKAFGNSQANQMLSKLCDMGLVYKNRYGKYSFAVPLFDKFIMRQLEATDRQP